MNAENGLALAVLGAMPLWAWFEIRWLKRSKRPGAKLFTYTRLIVSLWMTAACAMYLTPTGELLQFPDRLRLGGSSVIITCVVLAYFAATAVLPMIVLRRDGKLQDQLQSIVKERSFIYPQTGRERLMFVFVAITVGICEEILFRSFVWRYLSELPLGLGPLASLLAMSVLFGMAHYLQGMDGMIGNTLIGLMLGYLYFSTGSLLVPIAIHIWLDMKILLLPLFISMNGNNRKTSS